MASATGPDPALPSRQPQRPGEGPYDELLEWMELEPRTFGWDALVIYDQSQTNRLLIQEYINRYETGQYFEPITQSQEIVPGSHWEYLGNAVLDAPRLSFENSSFAGSKATLTMQLVSGVHFSVARNPNEEKRVTSIHAYSPLQGSKLCAEFMLNETDGSVKDDGRVLINLAHGLDFRMVHGTSARLQTDLGEFFHLVFKGLDPDQQVFVLNEIVPYDDDDYFKPDEFRIRTMPDPEAANRRSDRYGKGSVMVFITSEGSPVPGLPDAAVDWRYVLPEDNTASVLVSDAFMLRNLMGEAIRNSAYVDDPDLGRPEMEYVSVDGGSETYLRVVKGRFCPPAQVVEDAAFAGRRTTLQVRLPLSSDDAQGRATFEIANAKRRSTVRWSGQSGATTCTAWLEQIDEQGKVLRAEIRANWACILPFGFIVVADELIFGGGDQFEWNFEDTVLSIDTGFRGSEQDMLRIVAEGRQAICYAFMKEIARYVDRIDAFRVNGILFRSGGVFSLLTYLTPRDVMMLGYLAASEATFLIDPVESVLQAGHDLTLQVPFPSYDWGEVEWEVKPVAGYDGELGSIVAEGFSAFYTAPPASSFPGVSTVVRITASGFFYTASALVRVVKTSVHVNPLVSVAPPAGTVTKIAAGTVSGREVTWTIKSATGATLTDVPPDDLAEFEQGDRFYVPGSEPTEEAYTVDEVTATNETRDSSATSFIVVPHIKLMGTVQIVDNPALPPEQVQFELVTNGGGLPGVTWTVLAGGGSIDAEGLYTVDPESPYPFAVVSGYIDGGGFGVFTNFLILPVPLVDLDVARQVLR